MVIKMTEKYILKEYGNDFYKILDNKTFEAIYDIRSPDKPNLFNIEFDSLLEKYGFYIEMVIE
jgi:hypothetical protein